MYNQNSDIFCACDHEFSLNLNSKIRVGMEDPEVSSAISTFTKSIEDEHTFIMFFISFMCL